MYPQAELTELARAKAAVRESIACRRRESVAALAVVTQPLGWLEVAQGLWRRFAPFAKGAAWPLCAVALHAVFRPPKFLRALLRWTPPVFSAVMALRRLRRRDRARAAGL